MQNVVVTGAAGFIGYHLTKRLLDEGYRVFGIDDLSSGHMERVNELTHRNFTFFEDDITNKESIESKFEWIHPKYVFHQAASKKNICLNNPHRDLEVNAGGTLNLLQISEKTGVEHFVHASTGSVYGEPEIKPSDETHPLNPCSYYGVSKLAGERYVAMYGLSATILRYFHVYGAYQEDDPELGGVVAIFANKIKKDEPIQIHGGGNQVRSFTHVSDVVEANIKAAESRIKSNINVASGIRVTINELAEMMYEYYDKPMKIDKTDRLKGDIDDFDIDNTRARGLLGINFKQEMDFTGI